jgi:hypothetical protein
LIHIDHGIYNVLLVSYKIVEDLYNSPRFVRMVLLTDPYVVVLLVESIWDSGVEGHSTG